MPKGQEHCPFYLRNQFEEWTRMIRNNATNMLTEAANTAAGCACLPARATTKRD
jgi:hypothetical protein